MRPISQQQYEEKRDHIRIPMDCPVVVQGEDGLKEMGTCINLSAGGILFQAEHEYPVGTRLWVHMEPKLKLSPGLTARVEVVRREYLPQARSYHMGARITEIKH